ncbi:hypothetical protein [Riemerella columbina]|uniref:hypothetical protein n=1 Tax=Riemerella columbina TaxID=103810 RepID=UPI00266F7AE5|nr:hypothetical protein [Riemerella columbina]WKS95822.1 hypothetical protein NYR17_03545 [Riemerella columbina]
MELIENIFKGLFGICVVFLHYLGGLFGMGYTEINYWLFVVLLPIIIVGTVALNVYYIIKYIWWKIMRKS